jgi:hypothetical protein
VRHSRRGGCLKRVYALNARPRNETKRETPYRVLVVVLHPVIELVDIVLRPLDDSARDRTGMTALRVRSYTIRVAVPLVRRTLHRDTLGDESALSNIERRYNFSTPMYSEFGANGLGTCSPRGLLSRHLYVSLPVYRVYASVLVVGYPCLWAKGDYLMFHSSAERPHYLGCWLLD